MLDQTRESIYSPSENNLEFGARCMLGSKSQLSIESKLLYKAILKPIWIYSVQFSGTVSDSNMEIIQRLPNKYLRIIVNAFWYINDTLRHDLNVPYVRDEIKRVS